MIQIEKSQVKRKEWEKKTSVIFERRDPPYMYILPTFPSCIPKNEGMYELVSYELYDRMNIQISTYHLYKNVHAKEIHDSISFL